jgi:hypothetical protein
VNPEEKISMSIHSMTSGARAVAAVLGLLAAGCSTTGRAPTDVGSMALPAPMAPGNLSTTTVGSGRPDTGSMALPASLPQGDLRTTRVR